MLKRAFILVLFFAMACGPGASSPRPIDVANCDTYCALTAVRCRGNELLYTNPEACMSTCATFATTGRDGDVRGNTLQCRLTYVFLSSPSFAYCANAGPTGGTACQ